MIVKVASWPSMASKAMSGFSECTSSVTEKFSFISWSTLNARTSRFSPPATLI